MFKLIVIIVNIDVILHWKDETKRNNNLNGRLFYFSH